MNEEIFADIFKSLQYITNKTVIHHFSDLGDWEITLKSGTIKRTRTFVFERITDGILHQTTGTFIRRKYVGKDH